MTIFIIILNDIIHQNGPLRPEKITVGDFMLINAANKVIKEHFRGVSSQLA